MAEYIDKDVVLEIIDEYACENKIYLADLYKCIAGLIKEIVAPVVRAKWKIDIDDQGWLSHKCTNCGYTKRTDVHVSLDWKYCPMCGAKMEG